MRCEPGPDHARTEQGSRPSIPRAVVLAALLAACSAPDSGAAGDDAPAATDRATTPAARRDALDTLARDTVVHDTIAIEGMPEPITLRLYRAPADFPLPFSTYLPEDMTAERTGPAAVAFIAAFGGRRNPDAALRVVVHPPDATEAAAHDRARIAAARLGHAAPGTEPGAERRPEPGAEPGATPEAEPGPAWVIATYRTHGPELYGTVRLGRHAGRYFHVAAHYPPEYGDGFAPRAARILDAWRWTDTGRPLAH